MCSTLHYYYSTVLCLSPPRASIGRRASGSGGRCWGFPGGPLPEQAQLQEQPGEHVHQQRQSQGGAQFRHGGHCHQGCLLPLLEVKEGQPLQSYLYLLLCALCFLVSANAQLIMSASLGHDSAR